MPSAIVVNAFLTNLIEIVEPLCGSLYVVTANFPHDKILSESLLIMDLKTSMHFRYSIRPEWWSMILQFFKIVVIQAKMSWALVKISRRIDLVIFYVGGANLVLSVITAKLLRKKIVAAAIGLGSMSYRRALSKGVFGIGNRAYFSVLSVLERANFFLADQIIVESKGAVDFLGLRKYKQKLMSGGARYINTEFFKVEKELKSRDNLIGYIGRLDTAKGVMNFVEAIPIISKIRGDVNFLIGGNGLLFEQIKQQVEDSSVGQKTKLVGWIAHNELPKHLNKLKLLVLPSYSEGLPTIILEAMACGTPVLATPVGGIPDLMKDEETGFILENNSPECIAKNVVRALNYPNLGEITDNARNLIEKKYTYKAAVERYRWILNKIMED